MFFYHINIPKHHHLYNRSDKIILWGSCFAHELKKYLYEELYDVHSSPYGIQYNPMSMAKGIRRVLRNEPPMIDELFYYHNEWHSLSHHGSYSHQDKLVAHEIMCRDFEEAKKGFHNASLIIFTFGTSYVYELLSSGEVVNNCHRLPTKDYFKRRRCEVNEITSEWSSIIRELLLINPQLEIIFTVSPICHYRDGAHDNRLSKAILLLAIDDLCQEYKSRGVYYFPTFEIMQDELREYRFYKEDLVHPSSEAVRYIMGRFTSTFIDQDTERAITKEWHSIKGMLHHQPLSTHVPTLLDYYNKVRDMLLELRANIIHSYIDEQIQNTCEQIERLSRL